MVSVRRRRAPYPGRSAWKPSPAGTRATGPSRRRGARHGPFDLDRLDQLRSREHSRARLFGHPRARRAVPSGDGRRFVALEDIDPIYFERTYHRAPAGEPAARAYALLASVMDERQRVGIGKVVMREKQYLAAVRPYGKGLALSTMLFADEVVDQSDIDGIPARRPSINPREKKMAIEILDSLASEWKPSRPTRKAASSSSRSRTRKRRTA